MIVSEIGFALPPTNAANPGAASIPPFAPVIVTDLVAVMFSVYNPAAAITWNGPYLKGDAVPLDPWNRPYLYRNPSTRSGHDYDLCSLGANGNGQGEAICN